MTTGKSTYTRNGVLDYNSKKKENWVHEALYE
jgi:hypothetical protein